ncbi:Fe-regulated protein 8 [Vanrija pseudolonga]|uniref:Fe-regulated protein 8 n=1 Tax=Vanrija pseudolonga TaxID=143232 RepID=A0AAF0YKG7_9TREE|nr:Fe-regulated protein 8 [Vanrija pseudolonga]
MVTALKNAVVVGASYVGINAAQQLAAVLPATYRVVLVEPHSHFHHLFAFPRFAIVPTHEHKAFVPFTGVFNQDTIPNKDQHKVVQARVVALEPGRAVLDREWEGSREIPFDYVVVATGTRLTPPGSMVSDDKPSAVTYFQDYQAKVKNANSVVLVGGGAVGIQMAADLKEKFPEKQVTLVHSRDKVMPRFHPQFHDLIQERFTELGIRLITNSRVVFPKGGFPEDGSTFTVDLADGTSVDAQLVIPATGQTPNNDLVRDLPASTPEGIINPANGFIRVQPTLQFKDPAYPNFFAVGDVADTGAHKAARPGAAQAAAAAQNILSLIEGKTPTETITVSPGGIHLTLGIQKNIIFRNPESEGAEPTSRWRDDGVEDMNIEGVWTRRGVRVNTLDDYHL